MDSVSREEIDMDLEEHGFEKISLDGDLWLKDNCRMSRAFAIGQLPLHKKARQQFEIEDAKKDKGSTEISVQTPEIVTIEIVKPAVTPKVAGELMKQYQEITKAILNNNDYVDIKGKKYKKKSAWRKYARFFNITDEIIDKRIDFDKEGDVIYAEFSVKAIAPNNRYAVGWGSCSSKERKFAHINHDLPAIAHTRAKNRAISDLIGAGEVSAEEMQ